MGEISVAKNGYEVLTRLLDAMGAGDMATFEAGLADDFEIVQADSLPWGGVYRGVEGWREFLGRFLAPWKDLATERLHFMCDEAEENFALVFRVTGTSQTGKPVDFSVCEHWQVRDGKVRQIKPHNFDTKATAQGFL